MDWQASSLHMFVLIFDPLQSCKKEKIVRFAPLASLEASSRTIQALKPQCRRVSTEYTWNKISVRKFDDIIIPATQTHLSVVSKSIPINVLLVK